jgi:hypothetical protein
MVRHSNLQLVDQLLNEITERVVVQTRLKFTRLGHPGMGKPNDVVLKGNASDDKIVEAIREVGRPWHATSNIRLVKNAGNMSLAFYVDGGKLGEGTISREWP